MSNFDFTFIIPTYNRSDLLGKKLENIFNLENFNQFKIDVIVVDNSSSPNELKKNKEIVGKFKAIYLSSDQGNANIARNTGLLNSRSQFVSFSDDDDLFRSDYLNYVMPIINSKKVSNDLIFSWADVKEDDSLIYKFKPKESDYDKIYEKNPFPSSSCVMNKNVFSIVGLWNPNIKSCQDWDLWIRCKMNSIQVNVIDQPLVIINKSGKESIGLSTNYYKSLYQINKNILHLSIIQFYKNLALIVKKNLFR
ncbi:MAG: glycosyltransferase family 2 protein [Balneola sp.]